MLLQTIGFLDAIVQKLDLSLPSILALVATTLSSCTRSEILKLEKKRSEHVILYIFGLNLFSF